MGKRIIIDESVLRGILMEMTKERFSINEIKSVDAYNKFYKNKIDAEVFETLMYGQKTMTPYHKAALDSLVANKEPGEYQPMAFAEIVSTAWRTARPEVRQSLIALGNGNKAKTMTITEFVNSIKKASGRKWYSENEMSSGGLVVLYEDDVIRVTCTTTYAASTKNFSHTHWCTASDIGGRYNGWSMFLNYTGLGAARRGQKACLVQLVSKANADKCFQFQYFITGPDEIMDFDDNAVGMEELRWVLNDMYTNANKTPLPTIMDDLMTAENISDLIKLTEKNESEEYDYWLTKTIKRYTQLRDAFNNAVWTDEGISETLAEVAHVFDNAKDGYACSDWGEISCECHRGANGNYALLRVGFNMNRIFGDDGDSYDDWVWSCNFISPDKFKNFQYRLLLVKKEGDGLKLIKELYEGPDSLISVRENLFTIYTNSKMIGISSLNGESIGEIPSRFWSLERGRYAVFYDSYEGNDEGTASTALIDVKNAEIVCKGFLFNRRFNQTHIEFPDGGVFTLDDIIDNYQQKNFFMSE